MDDVMGETGGGGGATMLSTMVIDDVLGVGDNVIRGEVGRLMREIAGDDNKGMLSVLGDTVEASRVEVASC